MAYSDVSIDVTAKQIEDAVKNVPELKESITGINEKLLDVDRELSDKVDNSAFRNNVEALQAQINEKQNELVAGKGIEIDGNVISALDENLAGTQGIEVLDGYDEHADPIKIIKLTEETYNLIQQIVNKENKLLSTDSNIELFETTDEFGNNVTGIQFGEQARNVVKKFGDLERQVENKADKEAEWTKEPIITVICDGTQHTYNFTGLNLEAMILVFESTIAEKTQAGRIIFNDGSDTDIYFTSGFLHTSGARYSMAYVDLKRKITLKGVGTDKANVSLQTSVGFIEKTLKGSVDVINEILFGSFGSVVIPNSSVIKIYGREKI